MIDKIKVLSKEVDQLKVNNEQELELFRISFLGKKGKIASLMNDFRSIQGKQKKEIGQSLNILKKKIQSKINDLKKKYKIQEFSKSYSLLDLTRTSYPYRIGSRHPISIIQKKIYSIFTKLGFIISEGPEIEDDWHVFSALNFAHDHPARDMHDTFFIKKNNRWLLRTHTSSVQIRIMEKIQPPIRIICQGRVYRNETISARSHCFFHQTEVLYINTYVSFANLKQILYFFAKEMFGVNTKIRLRPSFFPFTEPSAEMDISCNLCEGKGCSFCKGTGWVEILGCGMVDPNVLDNCGINSEIYSGYAFGMGIERIANLKYQIGDIRLFFENNIQFLSQFKSVI